MLSMLFQQGLFGAALAGFGAGVLYKLYYVRPAAKFSIGMIFVIAGMALVLSGGSLTFKCLQSIHASPPGTLFSFALQWLIIAGALLFWGNVFTGRLVSKR